MKDYGPDTDPSGGTRYSSNKPSNWWAMPLAGLRLIARVTTYGGEKYAPLDWAIGQSFSVLYDCTMRHLTAMQVDGFWSNDEESGLPHAAHAAWNLLTLCHFMAIGRDDLDDVSGWRGVKAGEPKSPRRNDLTDEQDPATVSGEESQAVEPPSEGPPPPSSPASGPGAPASLVEGRVVDLGREPLTLRDITDTEESPAWKDLKGYREGTEPTALWKAMMEVDRKERQRILEELQRNFYGEPYTPPYRSDNKDFSAKLPSFRPKRPRPRYDR